MYVNIFFRRNNGHVSRSQMRQVLTTAAVLLSREERFALEQRYNDDLGFNYFRFIEELETFPVEEPLYNEVIEQKKQINSEKPPREPTQDETNIVVILAKIKAKVVRECLKVKEFRNISINRNNEKLIFNSLLQFN